MSNSRKYLYKDTAKSTYLKQLLERLETEYIQILEMVKSYNINNERGIGFWSLVRIIFPVIETVAFVVNKQKEEFLENDLHTPYGYLVWEIYRHSLMHGDELRQIVYKGKTISWGAHLDSYVDLNHFVDEGSPNHPFTIHIIIPRLYYDLRDFLVKEIRKNDKTKISIPDGVEFPDYQSKLVEQLEKVYKIK